MSTFLTPLDHILTNRGKVRLLRALIPLSRPVSGREAAKLARLSQTPALRALNDLVALGILHRMETFSQHLYEVLSLLNEQHRKGNHYDKAKGGNQQQVVAMLP